MLTFILLLTLPALVVAESVTSYSCIYPLYSTIDGGPKSPDKEFKLIFIIDGDKSYITGNNAAAEVMLIPSKDKISFIEITKAFNLSTTTITNKLDSVHSRNTVIAGEIVASQYYGSCEAR